MKAFNDALTAEFRDDTMLGVPAKSRVHLDRRFAAMAAMTGGKGFRTPAKQPKIDAQGLTRGDRKRRARAIANTRVREERDLQFLHSSARRAVWAAAGVGVAA